MCQYDLNKVIVKKNKNNLGEVIVSNTLSEHISTSHGNIRIVIAESSGYFLKKDEEIFI